MHFSQKTECTMATVFNWKKEFITVENPELFLSWDTSYQVKKKISRIWIIQLKGPVRHAHTLH